MNDELLIVRDDAGRVHQVNPLGAHACLGCSEPFPCAAARGGEQLILGEREKGTT